MESSKSFADSAVASTPARRWKRKSAPCVMGHVANRCPFRNHVAARVQTVFGRCQCDEDIGVEQVDLTLRHREP
jgi:hypothetical protein